MRIALLFFSQLSDIGIHIGIFSHRLTYHSQNITKVSHTLTFVSHKVTLVSQ